MGEGSLHTSLSCKERPRSELTVFGTVKNLDEENLTQTKVSGGVVVPCLSRVYDIYLFVTGALSQ